MVTFSSQQTLIHDRDSLVLEGEELITQERATAEDSMIAIFHYDAGLIQVQMAMLHSFRHF